MMQELLDLIKERVEDVLGTEFFDDPAGGETAPMVRIGGLPPKRSAAADNDEDFPFVVIRPLHGKSGRNEEVEVVQLVAGIYTSGDILAGFNDIARMKDRLTSLISVRTYTPYMMMADMQWQWGEEKTGQQPHPYHYVTISVPFKRAPQATSR